MHALIEKYGKQITGEIIDIILIKGAMSNEEALKFVKKHGLVGKGSQMASAFVSRNAITSETVRNEGGRLVRVTLEEPFIRHGLSIRNGRNQIVVSADFKSIDIPQLMEELRNETIQTIQ